MPDRRWRLIVDAPADPAWNMAVDDALLDAADADPTLPPVLRLYGWKIPTLSLGRGQPWSETLFHRAKVHGVRGFVRRPTGGRSVIHGRERTYAVVARLRSPPFDGSVGGAYRLIERALQSALRSMGLENAEDLSGSDNRAENFQNPAALSAFSCFQEGAAHETCVEGRKLIGSAQVRRRTAFLQHGTLPLSGSDTTAQIFEVDAPRFTDLKAVLGRTVPDDEMNAAWVAGFEREFGAEFDTCPLNAVEQEHVRRKQSRFAAEDWLKEGRENSINRR